MKLTNQIKAILLLIIICINAVESSTKYTNVRLSKRVHHKKSKNRSKDDEETILSQVVKYLKKEITDPENILYFVIGVLSVFWESLEDVYHNLKPKLGILKTCISASKISFKMISQALNNDEEDAALEQNEDLLKFIAAMGTKDKQKDYCLKVQSEIDQIFDEAELKKNDRNYGPIDLLVLWFNQTGKKSFVSNKEYCDQVDILKKRRQISIIENYGSIKQYKQQCIYFKDLDCETMEVETGIIDFIKTAHKYFKYVHTIEKCIVKVLGENDFIEESIKSALSSVAGFAANIFSFGAWGGIKGAYKIFKLAKDLKKKYDDFRKDLAFNVGQIVGRGIEIAKSILLGKKKRRSIKNSHK